MDYNIEPGIGTELDADSVGAGLLAHERAYLAWLDSVFKKYPDLVIENCSSGGLRIDYALLSDTASSPQAIRRTIRTMLPLQSMHRLV